MFKRSIGGLCMLFILATLVFITGCDYQGSANINQPPEVFITSFTGRDSENEASSLDAVVYQQKIYWYGKDIDGVIVGYAYRILNEAGDAISTAGNEFISGVVPDLSSVDPTNKGGWVLHYKKGSSEDYPLYDARTQTTVWTEKVFTDVNFPAADTHGLLSERASSFEIVAIDNRGTLSKVAKKYFFTRSDTPTISVSTSKGLLDSLVTTTFLNGSTQLGQGVRMTFNMPDQRIGVITNKPWYFRYRIYQVAAGQSEDAIADTSKWYSTQYYPNPSEVVLKGVGYPIQAPASTDVNEIRDRVPILRSDYVNNVRQTYSVIDVQVVDLSGVHSSIVPYLDEQGRTIRRFRKYFLVNDKYKPAAMLYPRRIYALGNDHYSSEWHPDIPRMVIEPPKSYTNSGTRVAQLLFPTPVLKPNYDGLDNIDYFEWQLFGDSLTKFWIRWGYNGEYPNNNPHAVKTQSNIYFDRVLDASTNTNYGSEISDYYISLDGMRYPYPPLMVAGLQDFTFSGAHAGTEYQYLKVPSIHEISQLFIRSSLAPGLHNVRIRVEDLQNVLSEPDEFVFNILTKATPNQRSGVLYIDYAASRTNAQREVIKGFYGDIFRDLGKDFTYLNRDYVEYTRRTGYSKYNDWNTTTNMFPITLLDKYEYVLVATDLRAGKLDDFFNQEAEGFSTYLASGGKVVLIGNQDLVGLANSKPSYDNQFLRDHFGFQNPDFGTVAGLALQQYYFRGATPTAADGQAILPETTEPKETNSVRYGALNAVSYIVDEASLRPGTQVLYRFDCLPIGPYTSGSNNMTISESNFNAVNNKPVGFKFTPQNPAQGTTYTFTFPFFLMEKEHAKSIFQNYIFR